jgi:hypothetical protein
MTARIATPVSRRVALAGLGATGLGVALTARGATAQDASAEIASHPIVGAWRASTPGGPSLVIFHPDGTATFADAPTAADPALGLVNQGLGVARWELTGKRSVHFTATALRSDATGVFLGFVTVDGYPEVSEDGRTHQDDQSQVTITVRDADGAIVQEIAAAGAPPVSAYRMSVGDPGFPVEVPGSATPTS